MPLCPPVHRPIWTVLVTHTHTHTPIFPTPQTQLDIDTLTHTHTHLPLPTDPAGHWHRYSCPCVPLSTDPAGHADHRPGVRAAGGGDTVVGDAAEAAAAAAAAGAGASPTGPAGPRPPLPHPGCHAGRRAHPHHHPRPGAHCRPG